MARMYDRWVGMFLLILGVIGMLAQGYLAPQFTPFHNLIHLMSGVLLVFLGSSDIAVRAGAQLFGILYTLVGLAGLVGGEDLSLLIFPVNTLYNTIHLIVGLLGIYAGFSREALKT